MKQMSLVAFYRAKPKNLVTFIETCQKIVFDLLGDNFAPYDQRQVHATIVGLERIESGSTLINRNLAGNKTAPEAMDLHGFLQFLQEQAQFPLTIRIGGFQPDEMPFTSRDKTPYERTFSVQGNKLVAMGWPVLTVGGTACSPTVKAYPNTLDTMRRAAECFHIQHAYHQKPSDIDNDFFFRIGLIRQPDKVSSDERSQLAYRVRDYARTQPPLCINVDLGNLAVAVYEDETLPLDSTRIFSFNDSRLDGDFLTRCYGC